jgi:hypothetical protein
MHINTFIVDNFYEDADSVRQFALNQDFNVVGNFPGARTKSLWSQSAKDIIESIVAPKFGAITYWPDEYNGAYQITTAANRSWIHSDADTHWAGVVYLTPNAPLSSGTGFYRHKATGLTEPNANNGEWESEAQDVTKWELVSQIGNVYNRLILYRGKQFHTSMDYFGHDMITGRLFQTFFFNTEL